VVHGRVLRAISRLTARERSRIRFSIDALTCGPDEAGAHQLKGRDEWSLRVGSRRILFEADEPSRTILVLRIGPRGDVYH